MLGAVVGVPVLCCLAASTLPVMAVAMFTTFHIRPQQCLSSGVKSPGILPLLSTLLKQNNSNSVIKSCEVNDWSYSSGV